MNTPTVVLDGRPTPAEPTSTMRWGAKAVALLLVAGLVVLAVVVAASGPDGAASASTPTSRQMLSMHGTCQRWTDDAAPQVGGTSARASCVAMVGWMGRQLDGGQMTAAAMWGDATAMRTTCLRWASTAPGSAAVSSGATPWCDAMVGRMATDIGDWDDWMSNGHMMR